MSLRSERLHQPLHPTAARFLDSTGEDIAVARQDILASAAHASALARCGLVTIDERNDIVAALASAYNDVAQGRFTLDPQHEDIHMNIEACLTERLGDLGKRLHAGRSRNDQVATDLILYNREHLVTMGHAATELVAALHGLAAKAPSAIMPAYTHSQSAQPILFGHWCGMHAARFLRDLGRIKDIHARLAESPLGAAALAGTGFDLDNETTARDLGLERPYDNSMDAVSDRDHLVETAAMHAQLAAHISQFSEDVIQYVSPAFGFLTIDDDWATGSSIMPQKKNPDVFEVARAHAGTALGTLTSLLSINKGTPSTYNRDLQEHKRIALDAWPRMQQLVHAATGATQALSPVPEPMAAACKQGHMDATEVADHLVQNNIPFREAHALAARLVGAATMNRTTLDGLDDATIKTTLGSAVSTAVHTSLKQHLGAHACITRRTAYGGTAPEAVKAQQHRQQQLLGAQIKHWDHYAEILDDLPGYLFQPMQRHDPAPSSGVGNGSHDRTDQPIADVDTVAPARQTVGANNGHTKIPATTPTIEASVAAQDAAAQTKQQAAKQSHEANP